MFPEAKFDRQRLTAQLLPPRGSRKASPRKAGQHHSRTTRINLPVSTRNFPPNCCSERFCLRLIKNLFNMRLSGQNRVFTERVSQNLEWDEWHREQKRQLLFLEENDNASGFFWFRRREIWGSCLSPLCSSATNLLACRDSEEIPLALTAEEKDVPGVAGTITTQSRPPSARAGSCTSPFLSPEGNESPSLCYQSVSQGSDLHFAFLQRADCLRWLFSSTSHIHFQKHLRVPAANTWWPHTCLSPGAM